MKVIDLLNKIANEEDIPKKIKINGNLYRQANGQFWCDETGMYMIDNCTSIYDLNDEVEIIKEKKKIERLKSSSNLFGTFINDQKYRNKRDAEITAKINEILDKINKVE